MTNLVTLERALANLPTATTADERTIGAMIAAASEGIRRYCRRGFSLARHDEIHDGTESERLLLREYPVQAIESVRGTPRVVLEVTNTQSANQQARIAITSTGLELVRVASGTLTRDTTVTWASFPTLQGVATAVGALGNGWSARVAGSSTGDYGLWPSADLHVTPTFGDSLQSQGAADCRGRWAGIVLHVAEAAGYCHDARGWLYRRDPWGEGVCAGAWWGGRGAWRVQYTAGYAELPEAVVEACACWVSALFLQAQRDPSLAVQAHTGTLVQTWTQPSFTQPPARVAALLSTYRRVEIG